MLQNAVTYTSAAASVTGLATAATGAAWPLSATSAGDGLAHLITIKGDQATDHSAKTAVITGTDADGKAQSETVNLPNGTATVTSTKHYLTVTSIVPSATISTDTVSLGWAASSVSPRVKVELNTDAPINVGIGCTVASGSPTYAIQYSYDLVTWFVHATITGKTAAFDGTISAPVTAFRLAFAAAGGVTMTANQPGRI